MNSLIENLVVEKEKIWKGLISVKINKVSFVLFASYTEPRQVNNFSHFPNFKTKFFIFLKSKHEKFVISWPNMLFTLSVDLVEINLMIL